MVNKIAIASDHAGFELKQLLIESFSSDLEIEAFNSIESPNKHLAVVEGVDHMSLYSNTEHLAKVADVQAEWLKSLLFSGN